MATTAVAAAGATAYPAAATGAAAYPYPAAATGAAAAYPYPAAATAGAAATAATGAALTAATGTWLTAWSGSGQCDGGYGGSRQSLGLGEPCMGLELGQLLGREPHKAWQRASLG